MAKPYDVIVVGARCAGSPTAMLLAGRGHRVLLLHRASLPADTVSTLVMQPPAVECLQRWALLELVQRTDCPPIRGGVLDFGSFSTEGGPTAEVDATYAPRRTVLDPILAEAAAATGAEV